LPRRGSLFSHQELAIASYLKILVAAFRESGTKADDGMLPFIQANAVHFNHHDRRKLPGIVAKEVKKQGWDSTWRNDLVLERDVAQYSRTNLNGQLCRFFHINVRNRHLEKTARNCCVCLVRAFS
jgi:hypothetical protein